jgi:hypothetical protein
MCIHYTIQNYIFVYQFPQLTHYEKDFYYSMPINKTNKLFFPFQSTAESIN